MSAYLLDNQTHFSGGLSDSMIKRMDKIPSIFLMGTGGAGKTSIERVVFHKMEPHMAMDSIEATTDIHIKIIEHNPLIQFCVLDFPGGFLPPTSNNSQSQSQSQHHMQSQQSHHHHHHHSSNNVQGSNTSSGQNNSSSSGNTNSSHSGKTSKKDDKGSNLLSNIAAVSSSKDTINTSVAAVSRLNKDDASSGNVNDDGSHGGVGGGGGGGGSSHLSMVSNAHNNVLSGVSPERMKELFERCTMIVFVIDAQEQSYADAVEYVLRMIRISKSYKKDIDYEILIHKIDTENFFTANSKIEIRRAFDHKISEKLQDCGLSYIVDSITYHLTSIFDHSIFEAMSKIIIKLMPMAVNNYLRAILTNFVNKCGFEKAFIFDVICKTYIATDANLMNDDTMSLCSDMIDVVIDISSIYGSNVNETNMLEEGAAPEQGISGNNNNGNGNNNSINNNSDSKDGFDDESEARIELQSSQTYVLTLRQAGLKYLALVCLAIKKETNNRRNNMNMMNMMGDEQMYSNYANDGYYGNYNDSSMHEMSVEQSNGLIEYNVKCLRKQMKKLYLINKEYQRLFAHNNGHH